MTTIPANECTAQDIYDWYEAAEQLKALKNKEMLLRTKVFQAKFPAPEEGTNSTPLDNGWVLKGKYGYNRDLDMDAISTMADELREAGVVMENLIRHKPELITTAYRCLTQEQRNLVDNCLRIKPSTPSLEIVLPKRASKTTPTVQV